MKKTETSKQFKSDWNSRYVLTDKQVRQLIKDKIERARVFHEAHKRHEFVLENGKR